MNRRTNGFTLVELLVVIGIIALLIGILIPVLNKAREAANTVKCSANLHSIGQGIEIYLANNRGVYFAAYVYTTPPAGTSPATPYDGQYDHYTVPDYGYTHWSSFLYTTTAADAFQCPSVYDRGLPPTDPAPGTGEPGQIPDPQDNSTPDVQVTRCAYTVNEAIITRNKFLPSVIRDSAVTSYYPERYVHASAVKHSSETVLATEFWGDWHLVVDPADPRICKSHRTVSGYTQIINGGTDLVAGLSSHPPQFTHQIVKTVDNPVPGIASPGTPPSNSLGWVGRNHGSRRKDSQGRDLRKTNFLFCDGHVETKTIEETLTPFQWGDTQQIYSVRNAMVQYP